MDCFCPFWCGHFCLGYTSCVMPLWLLLPQLLSFRVCYLRTLVAMLSAWAISCLLFLLLRLHACGHFVPRHILPCCGHLAGTTDYMLPIVLLHHAHFAPRYILPWCGHLCWCYADWVLPVLLLRHAHFAPGCIACPGALLGPCCCCSYPVLIRQPNVFDFPILVWALLLGLQAEWHQ